MRLEWKGLTISEMGRGPLSYGAHWRREKECSHWHGYRGLVGTKGCREDAPDLILPILLFSTLFFLPYRTQGLPCVKCLASELWPSCGMVSPPLFLPSVFGMGPTAWHKLSKGSTTKLHPIPGWHGLLPMHLETRQCGCLGNKRNCTGASTSKFFQVKTL